MKIIKILHLFLLSLFIVIPLQSSDKLVFTSVKNSGFSKFALEVMSIAYLNIGIKISIKPLPGTRALVVSNKGKDVDGELFRISGIEKKYTNLIPVKVALHESKWVIYTKNKEFKVNGWQSLKPYKIGIRRGIVTTKNGTQGMQTVMVNNNEQLFKMLDSNRVDVIIISEFNGKKYYNKDKYKDIKLLDTPVSVIPVYHFLHKKNKHLIPKITQAMETLESKGIIQKIKSK